MAIHITPELIEAVYETLRLTPPFRGWKFPPADDVEFGVLRTSDRHADHLIVNGRHRVRVSHTVCRSLNSLTVATAHEMCHMRTGPAHGKAFQRAADQVCKHHGFERGTF